MVKVSLILPSLNVARYIEECLKSAIYQDLQDIEIICVDSGSTDGTLDIIREYEQRDSRVKLILSEKKSYGYQMNLGMRHASGKYIGIIETDDFVPKYMYSELYDIAEREQAEIVKADFYRFRTVGERIERTYNRLDPSDAYYGRVINPAEHPQVFRFIMNTWSGIYLRSFLEENHICHNETPGASYQDNGFWFKTFCCAKRIYFVNRPYYMNRRDNEASSVANPGKVYCMTEEWTHIYRWLKEDEARFRLFIGVYTLRKYHSLLFTYQRIAPEYRKEFIQHMGDEMERLIRAGEYDRKAFTGYEWRRMNQIIDGRLNYQEYGKARGLFDVIQAVFAWIGYEGFVNAMRRVKWKNTKDFVSKEAAHG